MENAKKDENVEPIPFSNAKLPGNKVEVSSDNQSDADVLSLGLSETLGTNSSKYNSNDSISPAKNLPLDESGVSSSQNSIVDEVMPPDPDSSSTETDTVNIESDRSTLNSSDIFIVEESEDRVPRPPVERFSAESTESDVHIIESSFDKIHNDSHGADIIRSLDDSVQIVVSDQNVSVGIITDNDASGSNTDSSKDFKNDIVVSDKLNSPVYPDAKSSTNLINLDVHPTYSTPNDVKCSEIEKDKDKESLGDSTESLTMFSTLSKKISLCVDISATVYMNKDLLTGEIRSVICDRFFETSMSRLSDGSSNLADVSKSVSPSSSSSLTLFPLPSKLNRYSSSSGSSLMTSASHLTYKLRERKMMNIKRDEVKLTDERINELKKKWNNSKELYKILDFVDRTILNTDCISNDDSLKDKLPPPLVEEPTKKALEKVEEVSTPVSTNKVRSTRGKRQFKVKFSDSENEHPKKRQRRVESTDVAPVVSSNFSEGDSVFAKWSDRKFYAATLGEMTTEAKWQVNFFDGDKKTLSEEFLIKAGDFTMVGHGVYASQGDDNFTPGIITGCELKDNVLQYIVARDKGDISVPCQFIYITESQARAIRGKTSSAMRPPTKINENVILTTGSKRSTRSKTRLMLDSPVPSSSGTQKAVLSDSDDDKNDDNEINLQDVAGVEPESHGVYENGIKLKGKALTGKMRFARTKVTDADASVLGPIPDEGSKYFKNLHILLTCTRPQSLKVHVPDENLSSSDENFIFSTIPFVKDRLKLQLQNGGGNVYNNFDDIPQNLWKSTYLISNRPNNSAIYLQCLAAGIKLVCHQWVIRCCTEKKKVPLQELPLGWSLERERYFMCSDRRSTASLRKLNLMIVDIGDKNFYKFWSKLCKLADINVDKLARDSDLEQINAVISETGYRDDHVDRVISCNIPLVTTTWLIQSLLHGEPRQFDGHKSYKTEYVESD